MREQPRSPPSVDSLALGAGRFSRDSDQHALPDKPTWPVLGACSCTIIGIAGRPHWGRRRGSMCPQRRCRRHDGRRIHGLSQPIGAWTAMA